MKTVSLASEGLYGASRVSASFPRNLALAVLLQAFRDAIPPKRSSDRNGNTWQQDALEWFFISETRPGSFHWICAILQLEPWTLRRWLLTYQRSNSTRKAKMATELFHYFKAHRVDREVSARS